MKFANHENQREPAEKDSERPLCMGVTGDPTHQGTAGQEYQKLDDFDRGKFAGAVFVAFGKELLQAQCSGVGHLETHQDRRQQRDAEEIEDVAKPGHARLYTARLASVNLLI
jgi:hypothetical protein